MYCQGARVELEEKEKSPRALPSGTANSMGKSVAWGVRPPAFAMPTFSFSY